MKALLLISSEAVEVSGAPLTERERTEAIMREIGAECGISRQ